MADSVVENIDATPVVEKETVTSSVKESPVKETNGSAKVVEAEGAVENGKGDNGDLPKENGAGNGNGASKEDDDDVEEVKENGDHAADDVCALKRKSCGADAEAPDATTPEKKAKIVEEDSPVVTEESNDAEAIEA